MKGHLHLDCQPDTTGRTCIHRQSFRAPMHLSKPYWDGHYLIINAINATAGLFSGDEIEIRAKASTGSSVILTSPSASRVHRARGDETAATVTNTFEIESNAWLDVCPEIFIPQAGARYAQKTRIDIQKGGGLFFIESLAPGRTASGETFLFERLDWTTDLFIDGNLQFRERYHLNPETLSTHSLHVHFPHSYYACCFLYTERLTPESGIREKLAGQSDTNSLIAASFVAEGQGLLIIKILTADSLALRRAIDSVRAICYSALGKIPPQLRKL